MELRENERLDYVNDGLELIQNELGLTFGTDALLLAGYVDGRYPRGVELGGGSGIISMLLLTRDKVKDIDCIEVQPDYAELIARNAEHNRLGDRLHSVLSDVRDYRPDAEYDAVFTNPPYMRTDSGRRCDSDSKNIARHEVNGDISDFCRAGAKMLRWGGSMYVVYRPDRLCDLIAAMRDCGAEPKRMTLVHADSEAVPSMVLIEGKRGARSGMRLTPPLLIYKDKSHTAYSSDMEYIMENGSFPEAFRKK